MEAVLSLINGVWTAAEGIATTVQVDPNTGASRPLEVRDVSAAQVDAAVKAATTAHGIWQAVPLEERLQRLRRAADRVAAVQAELAAIDAVETGIHVSVTRAIASGLQPCAGAFMDRAYEYLQRENAFQLPGRFGHPIRCRRTPLSPVAIIAPWNVPCGTIAPKVFVALLCGASVVVKPSERASTSICRMVRAMADGPELPAGALQVLTGGRGAGEALVRHRGISAVQFTGAASTAALIGANLSGHLRPFHAECGGSNVVIVAADADLDLAVRAIVMGTTSLNGQWCMGISRILAADAIYDDLRARLVKHFAETVLVAPSIAEAAADEAPVVVGPMAFPQHAAALMATVRSLGGTVTPLGTVRAGTAIGDGCFVQPAIIEGADLAAVSRCELFGPVASMHRVPSTEAAIDAANLAEGQLCCYLFTADVAAAYEEHCPRVHSGMIMINSVNYGFEVDDGHMEPMADFVGTAGTGSDGNGEALARFFTQSRWYGVNGPQSLS